MTKSQRREEISHKSLNNTAKMVATRQSFKAYYSSKENQNATQSHYAIPQRLRKQFLPLHDNVTIEGKLWPKGTRQHNLAAQQKGHGSKHNGCARQRCEFQAKNGKFPLVSASRTFLLWENDELKAFLIFSSGVRYMLERIKNKAMFPIFLQKFPEEKST
ncbi:hypothetical protein DVH24_018602 [Malus domestica]|uniref:Uncharacterized protein n=1 Tax=Malus domestica TaxID=3750 RepID=A0A498HPB0_MALDO|nr:hypothetical protein DVH24_018602 [Malus domestica]